MNVPNFSLLGRTITSGTTEIHKMYQFPDFVLRNYILWYKIWHKKIRVNLKYVHPISRWTLRLAVLLEWNLHPNTPMSRKISESIFLVKLLGGQPSCPEILHIIAPLKNSLMICLIIVSFHSTSYDFHTTLAQLRISGGFITACSKPSVKRHMVTVQSSEIHWLLVSSRLGLLYWPPFNSLCCWFYCAFIGTIFIVFTLVIFVFSDRF